MTRAKDHLHLIAPERFFRHSQRANGDRHIYALRTRFIPAQMVDLFECCTWPMAPAAAMPAKALHNSIDIRMRMRRMWT
jgi:DNA helicase-2/ATP-dependent DNA helicase PcrA